MAHLVSELECELPTDFALLYVAQDDVDPSWPAGTFATSTRGSLAMEAGDRYSRMRVRIERWDSRPDPVGDDWEDCDELPWEPIQGAGRLSVSGFDPVPGEGLLVDDLGPARVQVLASGRHQYSHTPFDGLRQFEPESWLFRFWPEPGPANPLAGPPRRIAGPLRHSFDRSPWQAAVHGWRVAGWSSSLGSLNAFGQIENAVRRIGRPFTMDDLSPLLGSDTWSSPVNGSVPMTAELRQRHPAPFELLEHLASTTGMQEIATFADAFACLLRMGLLARCETPEGERLVPSAAPAPVAPVLVLSDEVLRERDVRLYPHLDLRYLDGDMGTLYTWARGLMTTPRAIAVRLSLPVGHLVDTFRVTALATSGSPEVAREVGPDTVVTLGSAD